MKDKVLTTISVSATKESMLPIETLEKLVGKNDFPKSRIDTALSGISKLNSSRGAWQWHRESTQSGSCRSASQIHKQSSLGFGQPF